MGGRIAAAAADNARAAVCGQGGVCLHQLGRAGIVDLRPVPLRHAGVGLGDQRRAWRHAKDRRQEVGGADAAIGAEGDRRRVERLDKIAERGGRLAHHRAAGGVEARGERAGHAALARRNRRRAHFLRRRHGLDPGDIRAAFAQALDLLDEDFDRLVFAQRSERSEQVAGRPDGSGDDDGALGLVGDFARDPGCKTVELAGPALELVQHQAAAVGPEAVGQDDVGACVDKGPMQAFDPVGMLGVPEFRRIAGGQAHGEKVGAGRPVRQQRPALGQKRLQHVRFSQGPPLRLALN